MFLSHTEPKLIRDYKRKSAEDLVPSAFIGAEGRYEDWVYLGMIEREWKRPVQEEDRFPVFRGGRAIPQGVHSAPLL